MKIVQPSFQILDHSSLLSTIELGGRVCYKSEDRIQEGSAEPLIERLIDSKHESVLEHGVITVRFVCDRGVTHELVRHRLASFSQESTRYCVAGDSVLTTSNPHNRLTVSELYLNKIASPNGAWRRMKIRQLNEETGELQFSGIEDVFSMGRKRVLRVKTRLGYELVLTPDHEIYTRNGYIKAGELTLSSDVAVNGVASLYQSEAWLRHQYIALNKTATGIAREFGFNVSTVKKWVRKHCLPSKPRSYWNIGREPWNKGRDETDPRVAKQVQALRENHWDEGRYTGKTKKERIIKLGARTYRKIVGDECAICEDSENLHVHHIDGDRDNNHVDNLITVCASCHQRVHAKTLLAAVFDRVTEIENAGSTEVFDISMASDFHNFVANGIVVHNCNYGKEKFNGVSFIEPFFWYPEEFLYERWKASCLESESAYLTMLEQGATPQEARSVLPNSLKTEIVVSANPREWRHILRLRTAKEAHPQMRQVMVPLAWELAKRWPVLFAEYADVYHPRPAHQVSGHG